MLLRRKWVLLIGLAAACVAQTAMADNIVTGFSTADNPNGNFSYYYGTGSSTQTLYTTTQATTVAGMPAFLSGNPVPDSILIAGNTTGSAVTSSTVTVPNNTLWLDPEEYSVGVVFTAPASGTYDITGDFLGIDVDEGLSSRSLSHPVEILDDGTVVWSGTISSYGQDDSFNFAEALSAGDTIEFEVLTGSSGSCTYCDLGTGLDGSISEVTATPEPGTLALLGVGLVGLIGARRRLVA